MAGMPIRPVRASRFLANCLGASGFGISESSSSAIARDFGAVLVGVDDLLDVLGFELAQAGHFPRRGGQWYPQTVKLLMVSS